MAWRLIHTSAPRLLQAGRSGFGTVARHRDIPGLVVEAAEKSSQFSRQPGFSATRVVSAYRTVRSSAGQFHLFSRITDAGTDYSGRTNHLSQHLILSEEEAARVASAKGTPAGVMLGYSWPDYAGGPAWLGEEDLWSPMPAPVQEIGAHWREATQDQRRVGLLATPAATKGAVLEYPAIFNGESHPWILWLFAESQSLCANSGWGITFTTNLQPTDDISDFRWIAVPTDSPLLPRLAGSDRVHVTFESSPPVEYRPPPARPGATFGQALQPDITTSPANFTTPAPETAEVEALVNVPDVPRRGSPPVPHVAKSRKGFSFKLGAGVALVLLLASASIWLLLVGGQSDPQASIGQDYPTPTTNETKLGVALTHSLTPPPQISERAGEKESNASAKSAAPTNVLTAGKVGDPAVEQNASNQSEARSKMAAVDATGKASVSTTDALSIVRLFPDDMKLYRWPATSPNDLRIEKLDTVGSAERLTAPPVLQKGWKSPKGLIELQAAGTTPKDVSPIEDPRPHSGLALVTWDGSSDVGHKTLVTILSDSRPLQQFAPPADPVRRFQFRINSEKERSFLRLEATKPARLEEILSTFFTPPNSEELHLRLSATSTIKVDLAPLTEESPPRITPDDAERVRSLEFPVSPDGSLEIGPTAESVRRVVRELDKLAGKQLKPDEAAIQLLNTLRDELNKQLKILDECLTKHRLSIPGALPENYKGDSAKDVNSYVGKLIDVYMGRILAFSLDKNVDQSKMRDWKRSIDNATPDPNKAAEDAGFAVDFVVIYLNSSQKECSEVIKNSKDWLKRVMNFRNPYSASRPASSARAANASIEITNQLGSLLLQPPRPPPLVYQLGVRRGASGSWYLISTNVTVAQDHNDTVTAGEAQK